MRAAVSMLLRFIAKVALMLLRSGLQVDDLYRERNETGMPSLWPSQQTEIL